MVRRFANEGALEECRESLAARAYGPCSNGLVRSSVGKNGQRSGDVLRNKVAPFVHNRQATRVTARHPKKVFQ